MSRSRRRRTIRTETKAAARTSRRGQTERRSRIISLNATSTDEVSHAYYEKRHGLFTYYLLSGLKGEADRDDDGWTSIKELYGYVRTNVRRVSRRLQSEQTPVIVPSSDQVKDIALSPRVN